MEGGEGGKTSAKSGYLGWFARGRIGKSLRERADKQVSATSHPKGGDELTPYLVLRVQAALVVPEFPHVKLSQFLWRPVQRHLYSSFRAGECGLRT